MEIRHFVNLGCCEHIIILYSQSNLGSVDGCIGINQITGFLPNTSTKLSNAFCGVIFLGLFSQYSNVVVF